MGRGPNDLSERHRARGLATALTPLRGTQRGARTRFLRIRRSALRVKSAWNLELTRKACGFAAAHKIPRGRRAERNRLETLLHNAPLTIARTQRLIRPDSPGIVRRQDLVSSRCRMPPRRTLRAQSVAFRRLGEARPARAHSPCSTFCLPRW